MQKSKASKYNYKYSDSFKTIWIASVDGVVFRPFVFPMASPINSLLKALMGRGAFNCSGSSLYEGVHHHQAPSLPAWEHRLWPFGWPFCGHTAHTSTVGRSFLWSAKCGVGCWDGRSIVGPKRQSLKGGFSGQRCLPINWRPKLK